MQKILKRKIKILFYLFLTCLFSLILFLWIGYRSASTPISFLPGIPPKLLLASDISQNSLQQSTKDYLLLVDSSGQVTLKSNTGKVLISRLTYFAEIEGEGEQWGLNNIVVNKINDSSINIEGQGGNKSTVNLLITAHVNSHKLDFKVNTSYSRNTLVTRQSLVFKLNVSLSEVYLKNRKVDANNFEDEYWLQNEGARFGKNENTVLIYHTPSVSSLQLKTKDNLLFVNLDYYLDHPRIHVLAGEVDGQRWVDQSKANHLKETELNNSFSINIGEMPPAIPRLMSVPDGYEAGYVYTEHADGGNIKKQRAVYFGSEDITKAKDATGGFVGHKIPTTKSIFYYGAEDTLGESIFGKTNDTLLLDFLDQLYQTGNYEICLHTPENSNSTREILQKSMDFMKNRFNTKSWIDHGFYEGGNRESFVADGFNDTSQYYTADLWKEYGVKYFWSPAIEIFNYNARVSIKEVLRNFNFYDAYVDLWRRYVATRDLKRLNIFNAFLLLKKRCHYYVEINNLKSNLDNALPTPFFWQNPTRIQQFYSWATIFTDGNERFHSGSLKLEDLKLENLISNRGIFISHGYFVRDISANSVISEVNGKLVVNPYFDKILGLMAEKRDKGELYINTVKNILDYNVLLKKISFEYLPNGEVNITNNNEEEIKGLSLVIKANNVLVNGQAPSMKKIGDELIVWFNMPGKSTMTLKAN
ncbi:MAG: hypothetical protein ABIP35_16010 [Ginsengibacter sp.]